jgi:hypothetical protein
MGTEGQKTRSVIYEILDWGLKILWVIALGKYIGWWGG